MSGVVSRRFFTFCFGEMRVHLSSGDSIFLYINIPFFLLK